MQILWDASLNEYAISVQWDRPTSAGNWAFDIQQNGVDLNADQFVDTTHVTYDANTFSRTFPFTAILPLVTGTCKVALEDASYNSGNGHWTDPYGVPAWTTRAKVFTNTLAVPKKQ